tara:strand:+ start:636 stop:902 length:267 start_codon:yes stop_codon:yes gene_type:complete
VDYLDLSRDLHSDRSADIIPVAEPVTVGLRDASEEFVYQHFVIVVKRRGLLQTIGKRKSVLRGPVSSASALRDYKIAAVVCDEYYCAF